MRISFLLPDLGGGGAERVGLDLAYEFSSAGHQIEFVLMQEKGEFLQEAKDNFAVFALATHRARALPYALFRYLHKNKPDVIIAFMWPLTVIAPTVALLSKHRFKVIVAEHCILSSEYRNEGILHNVILKITTGLGYRLADRRVGVSEGVVHDMAKLSYVQPSKFDVIYNPVSPRPMPSHKKLLAAADLWSVTSGKRILTVGRMKAAKNYPVLLRAFAMLNYSDARLMFVGDGQDWDCLVALAKNLGIADRVIFAGFQWDPTPFYQTADLFVLSSDYEGFGNVIVEALSCGTPVVSTDCPSGPREILDGERFGQLVPVGNVEALACALRRALATPADVNQLKGRATHFLPAIAARKYLNLLGCE